MKTANITSKKTDISNPPGGILVWLLIILEVLTFLIASIVFLHYKENNIEVFRASQHHLNPIVGTINTVVLITSGYLMASSIIYLRKSNNKKSAELMKYGILLGFLFLAIKGFEYYAKIEIGIGFTYNIYFTFYWMMTGFHFIHVLFGIGLLSYIYKGIKKEKYNSNNIFDVASSITYWHMCDLIWILIFPIFYLL